MHRPPDSEGPSHANLKSLAAAGSPLRSFSYVPHCKTQRPGRGHQAPEHCFLHWKNFKKRGLFCLSIYTVCIYLLMLFTYLMCCGKLQSANPNIFNLISTTEIGFRERFRAIWRGKSHERTAIVRSTNPRM